jgi:DNA polymerase V
LAPAGGRQTYDAPMISRETLPDGAAVGCDGSDRSNELDRALKPEHGNVVIAAVQSELTCRRLYKQRGLMKLEAASPGHEDIVPGEGVQLEVWDVVTTVIKSLLG